jgi:hypothetical protein
MDILNLGGINEPSERPSKKKLKVIIGIGLLAGVMGMGSTLAASITLNGGTAVEFGQGVQLVTACDEAITVTPTSEFVNSTTSGQANFRLKTVTLADIGTGCRGKTIRITAFTDVETYTVYTLAGSGAGNITSPIAFAYNYGTTGNKFGAVGGSPLMAGCAITINATTVDTGTGTSIACNLNGSTDDTTARTLTSNTAGTLVITFKTGTTSNNIAQPVLAAAINKFALESNA